MKANHAPLLLVPFSEVRHSQPEDCLHYETVGVRGALHNWTIPAHRHEGLHQFQLLERGGAAATIDGREIAMRAPAIVMVAPGSVHGFRYSRETEGHQVTLPTLSLTRCLEGAGPLEATFAASFALDRDALAAPDFRRGLDLFRSLAAEFSSSCPGRVQALLAQATLIALWFLRQHDGDTAGTRPRGLRDALVQRFRVLLESHYREHRPLAFYADTLGVTADHLSRTCKQVTGRRALEMVHERLVLEARRLLAYTAMSATEIAETLGFHDPAYFSRFFARATGASPSNYRGLIASGIRAS